MARPRATLEHHLGLMTRWPQSWAGDADDLPPGASLVAGMEPFIRDLHAQGWSGATIRNHLDNLWLLGGELIRQRSLFDETGDVIATLIESVDEEGGPLLSGWQGPGYQGSFDATCRKFHRFLQRADPMPKHSERSPVRRTRRRPRSAGPARQ